MSDLLITMRHVRAARLPGARVNCAANIRVWCARHGVDMRQLAHHGLPIAQIEAIDDAYARRAVAIAHAEAEASSNG